MGERPNFREATDRLAKRIYDHERAKGRPISAEAARARAAETARQEDRRRSDSPAPRPKGRVVPKFREVRRVYRVDGRTLKEVKPGGD